MRDFGQFANLLLSKCFSFSYTRSFKKGFLSKGFCPHCPQAPSQGGAVASPKCASCARRLWGGHGVAEAVCQRGGGRACQPAWPRPCGHVRVWRRPRAAGASAPDGRWLRGQVISTQGPPAQWPGGSRRPGVGMAASQGGGCRLGGGPAPSPLRPAGLPAPPCAAGNTTQHTREGRMGILGVLV